MIWMRRNRRTSRRPFVPVVAITVDAEFPDQAATDPLGVCDTLLGILAARQVPATFFVVGNWASAHPERLIAIAKGGHHIGNHSYSHRKLTTMTESEIVADVTHCGQVLAAAGCETRPWFRAPYGDMGRQGGRIHDAVGRAGYRHVGWHAHGVDWKPGRKADAIVATTLAQVKQRWPQPAIVLFHSWPDATPIAFAQVLDTLDSWGAEFVALPAMTGLGGVEPLGVPPAARSPYLMN
jgi:peptidoglycan/xylan/chitin deacetylase (PgdA/CDA1 family)